jgi:DNA-binding transcriptional ArsR family regulator
MGAISLLQPKFEVVFVLDAFERLLWWLFAGSAGARTRSEVLKAVREQPRNAQQLSLALGLDYTTIRHHLRVMKENRIVVTEGESYGKLYFVSENMEAHWAALEAILEKTRKGGQR